MSEFTHRALNHPGEVFAEAADYIEEHGWIQGQYGEFTDGGTRYSSGGLVVSNGPTYIPGCRVCLIGAIATVLTGDPGEGISFRRDGHGIDYLYELIGEQIHQDPLEWNDSSLRTQDDVVRTLRALAARHG